MWIKWKYNDHCCGDFVEAEIPDNFDGYESVVEYICENRMVPTWSERFLASRIQWEKIKRPSPETLKKKITNLELEIAWKQKKLDEYKSL